MEVGRQRDGVTLARMILVAGLAAEFVVLVATGLWLVFFYRPTATAAWPTIQHLGTTTDAVSVTRAAHRLMSAVALPTAIATCVLVAIDARTPRAGWRKGRAALMAGPSLIVVVLGVSFTGYFLPWDQIALWAVTIGTDMRGYGPMFGGSVKYYLLGSREVTRGAMEFWFFVHTTLLPLLFVAALVVAWRPRRRAADADADATDAGADAVATNAG